MRVYCYIFTDVKPFGDIYYVFCHIYTSDTHSVVIRPISVADRWDK